MMEPGKGNRYAPDFRAKASDAAELRSYSRRRTDLRVARIRDSAESIRWCIQSDAMVAEETRQSAEDAMAELRRLQVENAELRRANEILTTASAFFAAGLDPTRC